jgi:hypothetical protein
MYSREYVKLSQRLLNAQRIRHVSKVPALSLMHKCIKGLFKRPQASYNEILLKQIQKTTYQCQTICILMSLHYTYRTYTFYLLKYMSKTSTAALSWGRLFGNKLILHSTNNAHINLNDGSIP